MREVVTGNHTVSHAARVARAQVVSAYPITPQTQVVEKISEFVADGIMDAKFIKVESEHSAMVACIGASAAGARAFTATSAQGLALMHEVLHWAANARLPVVLANINRAMGPPWTIWTDQIDSLSQRDTGWMQFYADSNQDIFDSILISFKVAEQVLLPAMVVLEAFFLSHTAEPVDFPEQEEADRFLPPRVATHTVDPEHPAAFGGLTGPDHYYELKYMEHNAMLEAEGVIKRAAREYGDITGRYYKMADPYACEDADTVLVVSGGIASTAKDAVDEARAAGKKLGSLKIWAFRPFPREAVRELLAGKKRVAVVDRNISFGQEGIFCTEVKASLYGRDGAPPVLGFIAGLGGRDVKVRDLLAIAEAAEKADCPEFNWYGAKP
ncbi:MAG: pyruvate ferredoxin oxidoreductase [candidate division Zixibacteria bacterium]|nr:pyruvate ferredoxin oxidoreductase [candidate division Zixibacteria bacterium]